MFFFFFSDTAATEIYTLSLHDALPISIEDCVALARRVGNEIWKRYRIPVFFYEAAATRPDRVNLENVRRGQFEGLREELKKNFERQPDVGEAKVHPTVGVTVVGAQKVHIDYDVNHN